MKQTQYMNNVYMQFDNNFKTSWSMFYTHHTTITDHFSEQNWVCRGIENKLLAQQTFNLLIDSYNLHTHKQPNNTLFRSMVHTYFKS